MINEEIKTYAPFDRTVFFELGSVSGGDLRNDRFVLIDRILPVHEKEQEKRENDMEKPVEGQYSTVQDKKIKERTSWHI